MYTPTPRKSVKISELPVAFRVNYLAMLGHVMPGCHPSFLILASSRTKRDAEFGHRKTLVALGATSALGGTGLEAVLEAAVDVAQRAHAAAAGGLAALGLLTPVVYCTKKNV